MSRTGLLVFSLLLLSVAATAEPRSSSTQSQNTVLSVENSAVTATSQNTPNFQMSESQPFEVGADEDICYKIRAYIFKRDDDHAPEFVRSTTCGPRRPHTKDTRWPDAKLIPAH